MRHVSHVNESCYTSIYACYIRVRGFIMNLKLTYMFTHIKHKYMCTHIEHTYMCTHIEHTYTLHICVLYTCAWFYHAYKAHIHVHTYRAHIHVYTYRAHIHVYTYKAHIHVHTYRAHIHVYTYRAHIHPTYMRVIYVCVVLHVGCSVLYMCTHVCVLYIHDSYHDMNDYVTWRMWMIHTCMCASYIFVSWHQWLRHVTHVNDSHMYVCFIYVCVMTPMTVSYGTCERQIAHIRICVLFRYVWFMCAICRVYVCCIRVCVMTQGCVTHIRVCDTYACVVYVCVREHTYV